MHKSRRYSCAASQDAITITINMTATIAARVHYGRCLHDVKKCRKLAELAKKYPSVQGSSYLLLRKAETVNEPDSSTVQLKSG